MFYSSRVGEDVCSEVGSVVTIVCGGGVRNGTIVPALVVLKGRTCVLHDGGVFGKQSIDW